MAGRTQGKEVLEFVAPSLMYLGNVMNVDGKRCATSWARTPVSGFTQDLISVRNRYRLSRTHWNDVVALVGCWSTGTLLDARIAHRDRVKRPGYTQSDRTH